MTVGVEIVSLAQFRRPWRQAIRNPATINRPRPSSFIQRGIGFGNDVEVSASEGNREQRDDEPPQNETPDQGSFRHVST